MITLILEVFHHFCKSVKSAFRQRENFMESLHSDGFATYLLIIWVEKIITLALKSKQKPCPSIVFLSIYCSITGFDHIGLLLECVALRSSQHLWSY